MSAEVTRYFEQHLRVWKDALNRWMVKCSGVQQERRTLEATGGLVADAGANARRPRADQSFSDAMPHPKPTGLTPEIEERLRQLKGRSAHCASAISQIQNVILDLSEAKKNGVWRNRQKLRISIRSQPKLIGRNLGSFSRDQTVVVLEIQGAWFRVKNRLGVEGWVHQAEIAPLLPTELSSKTVKTFERIEIDEVAGGRG
jgi:Bacterial SH3 domain